MRQVGCAAGLATIDYILEHRLMEHAMSVGAFCDRRMAEMMQRHQLIGDVRGIGAFPFNVVFFSLFLGSVTAPRRHAVDTRWLASANVHAPKFDPSM